MWREHWTNSKSQGKWTASQRLWHQGTISKEALKGVACSATGIKRIDGSLRCRTCKKNESFWRTVTKLARERWINSEKSGQRIWGERGKNQTYIWLESQEPRSRDWKA